MVVRYVIVDEINFLRSMSIGHSEGVNSANSHDKNDTSDKESISAVESHKSDINKSDTLKSKVDESPSKNVRCMQNYN